MKTKIDHVALCVHNFEWHIHFFEEVFGMEVEKAKGVAPERKVWFREGIQLNESVSKTTDGGTLDHIGIKADGKENIIAESEKFGCKRFQKRDNWFQTPTGIIIELK